MPGYLALVLHAHLPYVRHPEHPRFLEEHWLFEAITDCYLPLIDVLRDRAGLDPEPCLTLSLSPTLIAMLGDPLLQARYRDYLDRRARLCEAEVSRHRDEPRLRALAQGYRDDLRRLAALYLDGLGGDLVRAFADLEAAGLVELMTTAATHGYLPLLRTRPEAVRAQLRVGQDAFRAAFGHRSRGLWLPECGYYEGLEAEIAAAGFDYFVVDTHGLLGARPPPPMGVRAPLAVGAGVACFGRDPDSAREIWSPTEGFPGHPDYREYHSDIGLAPDPRPAGGLPAPGGRGRPHRDQVPQGHRRDRPQRPLRPRRRCQSGGGRRRRLPRPPPGRPGSVQTPGGPRPSWSVPMTPSCSATGGTRGRASSPPSSPGWRARATCVRRPWGPTWTVTAALGPPVWPRRAGGSTGIMPPG